MGFSVTGRVLNTADGEGVPDATVSLNNQIKGVRTNETTVLMMVCSFAGSLCVYRSHSYQQGGRIFPVGEHDSWYLHHPCQQRTHVL